MSAVEKIDLPELAPALDPLVNVGPVGGHLPTAANDAGVPLTISQRAVARLTATCQKVRGYFSRDGESRAETAHRIGRDVGGAVRNVGHWLRHEAPAKIRAEAPWALCCAGLTLSVKASLIAGGVLGTSGAGAFAASLAVGAITSTAFRAVRERMVASMEYKNMSAVRQGSLVSHLARATRLTPLFMHHAYGAVVEDGLLGKAAFYKKVAVSAAFGGACAGLMEVTGLSHVIGNVMKSAIGVAHAGDVGGGRITYDNQLFNRSLDKEWTGGGTYPHSVDILTKIEPTPYHDHAIHAGDAVPITPGDVKSQVQALLDSGELNKATAKAAKALLKDPDNGQRLKDFAYFLLNKEHDPQRAVEFYKLAAEAGNKQALADLAYLESKGIRLPAPKPQVMASAPPPSAAPLAEPRVVAECNVSAATGARGITNPDNVCSPLPDNLETGQAVRIHYPPNTGIPPALITSNQPMDGPELRSTVGKVLENGNKFVAAFNRISRVLASAARHMLPQQPAMAIR